ncbi:Dolichyl-phosphate-mannose-protein mannosyltransferase [Venenivibrio stagnispumantis]|uniref:Dolichyl-phosphate-mannose-protein mannosyltransferase n=1 Tax=Venenivibrio stagnispumantis TaxID=407998 RepID=A0AA45WKJ8_9AQUI|nr:Dolichyl-phosphate-mannose-protein mannosyltransferase [Venenivibrio stagnispumantis]
MSIISLDEAKNASCAREMMERGDYIVPTFNYELRTDKPPMHYYFMIIAYKIFGVNEFSARFFSSIFGAFTVLITFLFGKKVFNEKIGFLSAIILISSMHTAIQFHLAVPDPYLIFFITSALFSFYLFYAEKKDIWLYIFYISIGLGILTKGLVAFVLPSTIIFLFLVYKKELKFIKDLKLFQGFVIISAISLPWYIAVWIKTDGVWIKEFLFKHNIERYSTTFEGHGGNFLLPVLFVLIGILPFSIFSIQSIFHLFKDKKDSLIYLFIAVALWIIFFSFSGTKLPNYTTPIYPALSIIIGNYLSNFEKNRFNTASIIFYILLTIILTFALFYFISQDKTLSYLSYNAFYFIILTIGAIIGLYFYLKDRFLYSFASLSLSSVLMIFLFFYYIFPKFDKESSVLYILPYIEKDKPVFYYKRFNPAFSFYLKKKIEEIKDFNNLKDINILTREEYLQEILEKGITVKKIIKKKDLFENHVSVLLVL